MDWKQAMEEERAALGRVVALLCALAGLAELAAGRSAIVRALVLLFLRRAEATARDFAAGDAPSLAMPVAGFSPADALRLAASLRALARQVDRQARSIVGCCPQPAHRAGWPCPVPLPAIPPVTECLSAIVASGPGRPLRVLAPDTS